MWHHDVVQSSVTEPVLGWMILCHVVCACVTRGDISGFIACCLDVLVRGSPWSFHRIRPQCVSLTVWVDNYTDFVRNFLNLLQLGATLKTPFKGVTVEKVEKKNIFACWSCSTLRDEKKSFEFNWCIHFSFLCKITAAMVSCGGMNRLSFLFFSYRFSNICILLP